MDWELSVEPAPIISGQEFGARFGGKMLIPASILNAGMAILGRLDAVEFTQVQARVQVRRGATSEREIILESVSQPTGGFEVELGDCNPGGPCEELGLTGDGSPCARAGVCALRGFEVPFEPVESGPFDYVADREGNVLFGWAEQGVSIEPVGPNRGAYELRITRSAGEPIELNGFDVKLHGLPAPLDVFAWECVMGVNSRSADGVSTADALVSPSPDAAAIACPIQEPPN